MTLELNFDGLPGPSHNFAGLSPGNLASTEHAGQVSNPRAAALQGLTKMRFVHELGVPQAVLPPHPRPLTSALRALGYHGADAEVLAAAARHDEQLLRLCSSASPMWTANAATVSPSADTADSRVHFTVANLTAMFHRSLEASLTERALRAVFADEARFVVHSALPGGAHFADEGAANHTRLTSSSGARVELFAWGRRALSGASEERAPTKLPARQTLEASQAVARLHQLGDVALCWQQAPHGIDAGAFHTDVLAVGSGSVLLLHEAAFVAHEALLSELGRRLGPEFRFHLALEAELPVTSAVKAYPFNSQLVSLPDGHAAIIAPHEAEVDPHTSAYLRRVVAEDPWISQVHYLDLNQSMKNGGGPACLRLRVPLTEDEAGHLGGRVRVDAALLSELEAWVTRHYRDRLTLLDLADPAFLTEVQTALDELTRLLELGSLYPFQQP